MKCAIVAIALACALVELPAFAQTADPDAMETPPALPEPPSAPLSTTTPRDEVPRGFSAKVFGGASYLRIFSVSIWGGEIGAHLGYQRKHFAVYGGADLFLGQTEFGLGAKRVRIGGDVEARSGALRIGGGIHVTYLAVQRVTQNALIDEWGAGITLLASVDLARTETGRAIYLGAALTADLLVDLLSPNALAWGPTLTLGARY